MVVLREEKMVLVGLLLESEGIDELVVLLKVLVVAQEKDNLVDMVLGTDGRAQRTHEAVAVLDEVAVDDALDEVLLGLVLH